MFKVIVAGGRDFDNYDLLVEKLDALLKNKEEVEIVSGNARGADYLGEKYAKEKGYQIKDFPADWEKYKKAAGPIRNKEMSEYADATVCFWDGESRGTKHMIDTSKKKGLPTRVVNYTLKKKDEEGSKMVGYTIRPIEKPIAKDLIVKYHYSHKWTSCRYALGMFNEKDELVGVAVYGFPVGRLVVSSLLNDQDIIGNKEVLELTRLWVAESEGKNSESWFLGKTFWWLKKNDKAIKLLISYSDPMVGHVGGIYKATNWWYQGNNIKKGKSYKHIVFGVEYHERSCGAKWGSTAAEKLKEIDPNYSRIELPKKHRYLYTLDKSMKNVIKENLKHPLISYPKDNDNCNW
jgi:hypothetical protein